MRARRYGISLRVFNSIAHEWVQRTSEMSNWTPYLRAPMYYFVYHINTVALYSALLLKTLTTHVKNMIFFHVLLGIFSGPEILVQHRSLCDNC